MVSQQRNNDGTKFFKGNREEIDEKIEGYMKDLDGQVVCVSVSSLVYIRAGFHTQMSMSGTLERHPKGHNYRVYVSDKQYCYFENSDILGLSGHDTGEPVIHISINQITDPMELASKVLDSIEFTK